MTSPYWRFELPPAPLGLDDSVVASVLNVFRKGMPSPQGWHVPGAERSVRTADLALLLLEDDALVGYALYKAIPVPGDPIGRCVLWEESICFLPAYTGKKYGNDALTAALLLMEPHRSIGWIGGRTQNPIVLRRYGRFARGRGRLLPFGASYDDDKADRGALAAVTAVVGGHWKEGPDRFGITRGTYSEGKLGNYPEDVAGAEGYNEFLRERGFDRDAGDAVIALASQHLVSPRRRAGSWE